MIFLHYNFINQFNIILIMIPKTHPRYKSLLLRDKVKNAFKEGYLADSGMIAHGRGETFDYLIGEKPLKPLKRHVRLLLQQYCLLKILYCQ